VTGFDPGKPNVARMYDYFLGGKDNFAADRESGARILGLSPGARSAAQDNRRFLERAVRCISDCGIRQFVDIGAGIPTMENTHDIAARANWLSRVVYVDNDPVAVTHGRALLGGGPHAMVIPGDLREPKEILENSMLGSFIDMTRPVAIVLAAILHFLDDSQAYAAVDYLKGAVPPGSALVISHATADDAAPGQAETVRSVYEQATFPIFLRTHAEVTRFFDRFNLVGPGVTDINTWRADSPRNGESQTIGYGGVARKRPLSRPSPPAPGAQHAPFQ
jgi:O-methyltransferase involved in polyketide biosynthesis